MMGNLRTVLFLCGVNGDRAWTQMMKKVGLIKSGGSKLGRNY